jgi:hypothetical protein
VDLLQQNPSLAPKPAGGLPNMGYTTDRLGNIIRAPMAIPVFARGGDVDTNELLQRVNEYNLYGDDPAYYSESRNMLNALPVDETTYSESPSKIQVKRVRGQELRPKSSEGFGKGMAMEVESLTTSKGASPKALKGTAKDDFMELARTYKLKAKEAENMARGLSRDTFNAPTLERPTLTKGSLTKRRFEEGGEVKKSSQESEKEAGQQFDDPIRSGKPLQRRTRRAATQEENEALNRAVLQGAANMPYNLVGAPVDIANMVLTPAGLGSERPVMGSDWIKQKMTDLGVRPEMPTDPTQRALYSAADIGSSLVNPAAPVRAAARGAEKAGEAARMLAEDFQQYNRALGPAGASYAIKPKGGSWLQQNVNNQLDSLKKPDRFGLGKSLEETARWFNVSLKEAKEAWDPADLALNAWIDRNLGSYIKRDLASPKDPLRELAEEGISAAAVRDLEDTSLLRQDRAKAGFPAEGMARGPIAKTWENLTDELVMTREPSMLSDITFNLQPGLRNLPPTEKVYGLTSGSLSSMGFDHVVDVLRGDMQAGRLDPKRLNNISVAQAVRRADQFDKEMAKRQQQAVIKATSDLPVVKQYDQGYRWLELKPKLADDWKPPANLEIVKPTPSSETWAIWDKNTASYVTTGLGSPEAAQKHLRDMALEKRTQEVLTQEGNVMGHCIGTYCSDVMAGTSQNFSLRDAKGEQHVTIEVQPQRHLMSSSARGNQFPYELRYDGYYNNAPVPPETEKQIYNLGRQLYEQYGGPAMDRFNDAANTILGAMPPVIKQIKGKGNAKPKEEYLPFVQDFIKSGNWSEVNDLRNAGLVQVTEGQRLPGFSRTIPPGFYSLDELRQMAVENEMPQEILDTWMSKLGDQLRRGYAQGGLVDTSTAKGQLAKLKAA